MNKGESKVRTFGNITGYRQLLDDYWVVKVLWYNGEETWYPMNTVKEDDRIYLTIWSIDNVIPNMTKWKWERRLTNNYMKSIMISEIFLLQTNRYATKYKYWFNVTNIFK